MLTERKQSLLGRFVPELVRKHFPIVAESLDNFSSIVEREGASEVVATAGRVFEGSALPTTASVGRLGINIYYSYLVAHSRTGRKIELREILLQEPGSERGLVDLDEKGPKTLRALFTAHERLRELRERNPNLVVRMTGPYGRGYMDEVEERKMLEDAHKHDLEPFPENSVKK